MIGKICKVLRDEQGTGALELALVMPILMLMTVGMVDISRLVAAGIDAEQAAQRATDFALAHRPTSSNAAAIEEEAVAASGVDRQDVTVEIFLECNGIRQSSFKSACPVGQDRGRFVNVAIDREVTFLFDWAAISAMMGADLLDSSVVVRGDSLVRFQ